jgi:hypothetical protein
MGMAIRWFEDNAKILLLAALPVFIRGIDYHSANDHFTFCLFKNFTGMDCYGCGTLRGLSAFLHLDFRAMIRLNRMNAVTVPLLCFLYCKELYRNYRLKSAVPQNDRLI